MVRRVNDLSAQRCRWVGGIGSVVDSLALAADSADQAALASSAASRLLPQSVVFWDELGAYASLLRIPQGGLSRNALPNELLRLLEVDSDGQLRSTVHAYLDHAGSSSDAADALHIHRTTLYYRLGRVQELAGLDLAEGRTRLALHVGLELLRIQEAGRQAEDRGP
jgi:sugar diacid utilization regulator